jgi:hypothetical protein
MRPTHHGPYSINAARAIHQQRAAWVIRGNVDARVPPGPRIAGSHGMVPCVPLPGARLKLTELLPGPFPFQMPGQGVSLCHAEDDVVPATVTTTQPTTGNDAFLYAETIQLACNGVIHPCINAPHEGFLGGHS